jgi:hypothetical protein
LVSNWASHFELLEKNDIAKFAFHFLYNKKGFKIIEWHVQGTTRHYMNNIREFKKGLWIWTILRNENEYKQNINDIHVSKHHKEVKRLLKTPLKNPTLNLKHLTSTYHLESIVVEDNQNWMVWPFKPKKTSIIKNLMMGRNIICILKQFKLLKNWKNTIREWQNIPKT